MAEVCKLMLTKKNILGASDGKIVAICDALMKVLEKIDACFTSFHHICSTE
jgi:hypothetical protein